MKVWESGRESSLLADIRRGDKTVEGRLYRDKFAQYRVGDWIYLREDVYEAGKLVKEIPRQVLVEVVGLERYGSFAAMLAAIGYQKALPRAASLEDAVQTYRQFYTAQDEARYGVIAIHIKHLQN